MSVIPRDILRIHADMPDDERTSYDLFMNALIDAFGRAKATSEPSQDSLDQVHGLFRGIASLAGYLNLNQAVILMTHIALTKNPRMVANMAKALGHRDIPTSDGRIPYVLLTFNSTSLYLTCMSHFGDNVEVFDDDDDDGTNTKHKVAVQRVTSGLLRAVQLNDGETIKRVATNHMFTSYINFESLLKALSTKDSNLSLIKAIVPSNLNHTGMNEILRTARTAATNSGAFDIRE
eukprot:CAMPEP_0171489814 /NCGR_PEP_ID=MMETSP0958-20121227/2968_1 /TAXON_ID=87120 /ORGANISM="Aurantiochytrium limacinum, Strain ATCCMYA-1381" /LENGTH=233 /DNA_ID=CAMNT_0012023073 /DNA_START=34 /DNA_END=732 /DNA_ORIENTATION=-